jgi:stalled ribosome alternative rescue factor ArfA
MAFQGNAMDKLKTDKLQRNRSEPKKSGKTKIR